MRVPECSDICADDCYGMMVEDAPRAKIIRANYKGKGQPAHGASRIILIDSKDLRLLLMKILILHQMLHNCWRTAVMFIFFVGERLAVLLLGSSGKHWSARRSFP